MRTPLTKLRYIDKALKKEYYFKYKLNLDDVDSLCHDMCIFIENRERHRIINKYLSCLKSLQDDMRSEKNSFYFDKRDLESVNRLIELAKFQPFPRKKRNDSSGRPHLDPEKHIVWELSCAITYQDGPREGDTCWQDVMSLIRYFMKHYTYLRNLPMNDGNLRNFRNTYRKSYKLNDKNSCLLEVVSARRTALGKYIK